jgi:hypothetical protein
VVNWCCQQCNMITLKVKRCNYKQHNHLSEVLNRIECFEANKPTREEIESIKGQVSSYDKESIYKISNFNQRKHLIYIYCKLNAKPFLRLTQRDRYIIDRCFRELRFSLFFKDNHRRNAYNFHLILDVINDKYKLDSDIKPYLYYKTTKNTPKMYQEILNCI